MTTVLALRPDGAHGDPADLTGGAAAGGAPDSAGPEVAHLDDVIDGQPTGYLAGADLPKAEDLAAVVHTGGTTGAPEIAAHTHANQLACGQDIALSSGLAPGEGVLGGLPLFHVNALIVTGIAPMFSGTRVVWPGPAGYRDKALYTRSWQIIEHYQIAAMSAVPTVYATLAQVPVDADISTLRLPIVGASPLPSSVREDFARHTGRRLLEGYGLTEATCASTWTRPGEERPGSVGRALPGQQVKAVRIGDDGSKRIYPITAIPVTAVGKHFKLAPIADAAIRATTEALAAAGVADARATAAHGDGRLVVTVTGADPGQVRDAGAGFASPSAPGRRPPPRPPQSDPQKETRP